MAAAAAADDDDDDGDGSTLPLSNSSPTAVAAAVGSCHSLPHSHSTHFCGGGSHVTSYGAEKCKTIVNLSVCPRTRADDGCLSLSFGRRQVNGFLIITITAALYTT